MSILSYIFPQTIAKTGSPYNKDIRVVEKSGNNILLVNGIEQSGPYTTRLWTNGLKALYPTLKKPVSQILIFGVGGGTMFPMLHREYPDAHITAVDIDSEIIRINRKYFDGEERQYVTFVRDDAKRFVQDEYNRKRFDVIIIDLYIANDVPDFVTDTTFHASVKQMLTVRGVVLFNYFSFHDQPKKKHILVEKLKKIYSDVMMRDVLRNVFFYCS